MRPKDWTRKEETHLATLRAAGWSFRGIGKLLCRSEGAVRQRAYQLSVPRSRRKQGELERLVRWYCGRGRWEDWEVALFLNAATKTVANCRIRLGIPAKNQAQSKRRKGVS